MKQSQLKNAPTFIILIISNPMWMHRHWNCYGIFEVHSNDVSNLSLDKGSDIALGPRRRDFSRVVLVRVSFIHIFAVSAPHPVPFVDEAVL